MSNQVMKSMLAFTSWALAAAFTATTALIAPALMAPVAIAKTLDFKVLELDQNQTGPYALFSGGVVDGLKLDDKVCILKDGSKSAVFCTKIVSIRQRAAAFYIPDGHQADVLMGTVVTFDSGKSAESSAETTAETTPEEIPGKPWFLPRQYFDAAYHLQITPAISANSVSFAALPRTVINEPLESRDALNIGPLGFGFGYARDFLSEGHHLGLRGFYSRSNQGSFDNDYDLSDAVSHVETDTVATTLGLTFFYGIDHKMTDDLAFRASGGLGFRRASAALVANLKGSAESTLVDGTVVTTAPVIEGSGGAKYKAYGIDWTSNLVVAVPLSVKSTASGTFNSFQDVTVDDVKVNLIDAAGSAKGVEISLDFGVSTAF